MRGWIKLKTVIIVPDNGLYTQREGTEMALMCYGGNKLQQKLDSISFVSINKLARAHTSVFNNFKEENETKDLNPRAQKDHWSLQKGESNMI
ncbi:hypothetical protein Vadar_011289 [Vaccinium darrowii]|uniref:Uncharacterized protein n=1 Tax=Vaccinium darrowii TaxID=229202 RepID=A0ACB7WZT8_9ERIC|nr:hypothetical protein Vadar_011289 [Vaccinium darrowii]